MKGLMECSRRLVPAGLSQKSLHKSHLVFEGDYFFKMRVTFLEGLGTGKKAGDGHLQAGSGLESQKATESTAEDIKKLKTTLAKSWLAAHQPFGEELKTANACPKLPWRRGKKVTQGTKGRQQRLSQ